MCRWILAIGLSLASAGRLSADERPEREVHAIGVKGEVPQVRPIEVKVDRPGKLVTLVIGAEKPATFKFTVEPKSKIEKIIITGLRHVTLQQVPSDVEVVEALYELYVEVPQRHIPYHIDHTEFRRTIRTLQRRTGQDLSSFHGELEPGAKVAIDQVQKDPRLLSDYPRPLPAKELPDLRFHALHIVPPLGSGPQVIQGPNASYGEFRLTGPVPQTLVPISQSPNEIVFDAESNTYFGIGESVYQIDLRTRKAKSIGTTRYAYFLALDTKRKRLLTASMREYLAYDLTSAKWSAFPLDGSDATILSMVYAPETDQLFAIAERQQQDDRFLRKILLQVRDGEGKLQEEKGIDGPVLIGITDLGNATTTQLKWADGRLVLVTHPPVKPRDEEQETFVYLIDPKTAKAVLASRYVD